MTQVARNADPTPKRMGRIARVLALIWAACWTVASVGLLLAYVDSCAKGDCGGPLTLQYVLIVGYSLTWLPTAIAWRWETVGGVMLVLTGGLWLVSGAPSLLPSIWGPVLPRGLQQDALLLALGGLSLLLFSGPPLAAGFLLLASARRSSGSEIRPASR
jgi:hypothetical protein